MKKLPY